MCRSSAAVKLLASESVNIVEGRGFESRRQLFFFFFFNIHTSYKLEIFFDHSILVNAALIALTQGGQIKYPMMLCTKISQVLFCKLRKNCSNGDFPIVEYTGIKILKGWISCYIESSLYIFCKVSL